MSNTKKKKHFLLILKHSNIQRFKNSQWTAEKITVSPTLYNKCGHNSSFFPNTLKI